MAELEGHRFPRQISNRRCIHSRSSNTSEETAGSRRSHSISSLPTKDRRRSGNRLSASRYRCSHWLCAAFCSSSGERSCPLCRLRIFPIRLRQRLARIVRSTARLAISSLWWQKRSRDGRRIQRPRLYGDTSQYGRCKAGGSNVSWWDHLPVRSQIAVVFLLEYEERWGFVFQIIW